MSVTMTVELLAMDTLGMGDEDTAPVSKLRSLQRIRGYSVKILTDSVRAGSTTAVAGSHCRTGQLSSVQSISQ